jgi:hypothetical protein
VKRPNLFLIGSMKSGTTTLHELLAEHPDICMSEPKEPCYFVDPEVLRAMWPQMWALRLWESEDAYLRIFPKKHGARYVGESSTDYSKRPKFDGVVERIARFNPESRFVYIMRDPVERTISHYWHMVEHRGETRAPLRAIQEDPHYTEVSNYAMQLAPYIERFGRAQIYVLSFEELTRAPLQAVRGVFEWLGVSTDFVPAQLTSAHNVTPAQVRQRRTSMDWLRRLRHSALWSRLGPLVPARLRKFGVSLIEKPITRCEVDVSDVIAYLRPIQQVQTRELVKLVCREFPEWKTLHGS